MPSEYVCKEGTNNDNIELCPLGFYCDQGTKDMYQYHICIESYYCDMGSTSDSNKKNPCLSGCIVLMVLIWIMMKKEILF